MRAWLPLLLVACACSEPDYTPLRADIVKSGETVCAPPPARSPYGAKTRDVKPEELDAALKKLCESDDPLVMDAWAVVKEALAEPKAVVGMARKKQHRLRAGIVDRRCDSGKLGLERKLLLAAAVASADAHYDIAGEHCADALAVLRESLLTGGLIDAVVASQNLDELAGQCGRYLDLASPPVVRDQLDVYRTLRASLPKDLHDVMVRDRAELTLSAMGALRDRSVPLACERANALAAMTDDDVKTRSDRYGVYQLWQKSRDTPIGTGAESYEKMYADALWKLDVMLRR